MNWYFYLGNGFGVRFWETPTRVSVKPIIYIYTDIHVYIYIWLIASDVYTRTFNATCAVSRLTAGKCKLLGAWLAPWPRPKGRAGWRGSQHRGVLQATSPGPGLREGLGGRNGFQPLRPGEERGWPGSHSWRGGPGFVAWEANPRFGLVWGQRPKRSSPASSQRAVRGWKNFGVWMLRYLVEAPGPWSSGTQGLGGPGEVSLPRSSWALIRRVLWLLCQPRHGTWEWPLSCLWLWGCQVSGSKSPGWSQRINSCWPMAIANAGNDDGEPILGALGGRSRWESPQRNSTREEGGCAHWQWIGCCPAWRGRPWWRGNGGG